MASKVVSISASPSGQAASASSAPASAVDFGVEAIQDPALRAEIQYHVNKIRLSIRRTAWEVVEIGRSLAVIKEKLGWGRWEDICKKECGIVARVARRMMDTAQFVDERLKERRDALDNLSSSVLYRLAEGNLAQSVVEEMIHRAAEGTKVTPADLKAALERLQKEVDEKDTRNEQLESDNTALRKDMEREATQRKDAELRVLQLKEDINRHAEALEMASSERRALLDERGKLKQEIDALKANPVEKEVPKLPPEYATLQEALQAKERRLREVSIELQRSEARIAECSQEVSALDARRADAKASSDAVASLEAEVQALGAKYTAAYVASAAADAKLAARFARIASLLRKLADQMERPAVRGGTKRR